MTISDKINYKRLATYTVGGATGFIVGKSLPVTSLIASGGYLIYKKTKKEKKPTDPSLINDFANSFFVGATLGSAHSLVKKSIAYFTASSAAAVKGSTKLATIGHPFPIKPHPMPKEEISHTLKEAFEKSKDIFKKPNFPKTISPSKIKKHYNECKRIKDLNKILRETA